MPKFKCLVLRNSFVFVTGALRYRGTHVLATILIFYLPDLTLPIIILK